MLQKPSILFALILPIPGLAVIALGLGSLARRGRKLVWLFFWMVLASLLILPACGGSSGSSGSGGGGGGGTPAGTYTITISGKDANNVTQTGNSPTVTVTVN